VSPAQATVSNTATGRLYQSGWGILSLPFLRNHVHKKLVTIPNKTVRPAMAEQERSENNRTGRMTKEDHAFILRNMGKLTIAQMAAHLGRRESAIEKFLRSNAITRSPQKVEPETASAMADARTELKKTEAWKRIRQEFSEDELRFFEEQYLSFMSQFQNDVLPSEVSQIFDYVKIEVLKSRNLIKRQSLNNTISEMEEQRNESLGGKKLYELDETILKVLNQLNAGIERKMADERTYSQEYSTLQQRSEALLKSLKSTRDQRIKEIENTKDSIISIVKDLGRKEVQERESRWFELNRMAAEKELQRLGSLHEYEDGGLDRPILSAETIPEKLATEDDVLEFVGHSGLPATLNFLCRWLASNPRNEPVVRKLTEASQTYQEIQSEEVSSVS
jgi:hypothetical protein